MTDVGCSGPTLYGPFDVRIVGVFPDFGRPHSVSINHELGSSAFDICSKPVTNQERSVH